jgi:phenylpyruvate tautomerase PptA (4-oxalocrotonate tautomerase family)
MPLYTLTTQTGILSVEAKASLAAELTKLHSEYSGVPKNWVHVIFHNIRRAAVSRPENQRQRLRLQY